MKQTRVKLADIQQNIQKNHAEGYYAWTDLQEVLNATRCDMYEIVRQLTDIRMAYGMNRKPVCYYNLKEAKAVFNRRVTVKITKPVNLATIKDKAVRKMIMDERRARAMLTGKTVTVVDKVTKEEFKGTLDNYSMMGFWVDGELYWHKDMRIKELDEEVK